MLLEHLALAAAALFAGAAVHVGLVEQPARLALDDRGLLAQWTPSCRRGGVMLAGLAILGSGLGAAAWIRTDGAGWIVGALILLANVPVTVRLIRPLDRRLRATDPERAGPQTRALILRWGRLHLIRTALGVGALLAFLGAGQA